MNHLAQSFSVNFNYTVYFTQHLFSNSNTEFIQFLKKRLTQHVTPKILFVIDEGVLHAQPELAQHIQSYFSNQNEIQLIKDLLIIPGGEIAKNNSEYLEKVIESIDHHGIDRHSYVVAIGGGSILDLVGYAASISHRGIQHIRIPTTVLSQNDSGVGVKNGINYKGKKNFLGCFTPPVAVFNDAAFLETLDERQWRSGISEAIKVALIKDAAFFQWIEDHASQLANRDLSTMNYLIHRCAELHLQHIASGDPFELGSSRPLDFGHWSAHKLEQISNFEILHGEAVAMGIAMDSIYSQLSGRISLEKAQRIINLIIALGFEITHPLLHIEDESSDLYKGLNEFREHLGGRLTIMLLKDIGVGEEVHELDMDFLKQTSQALQTYQEKAL